MGLEPTKKLFLREPRLPIPPHHLLSKIVIEFALITTLKKVHFCKLLFRQKGLKRVQIKERERAKMPYISGFLDQVFRNKQIEGAKNFLFEKVPQTQVQMDQRTLSEITKRLLEQQKEIAKINEQLINN